MGISDLFWCDGCGRYGGRLEVLGPESRPRGWLRVESRGAGFSDVAHFCPDCGEIFRERLAVALGRDQ